MVTQTQRSEPLTHPAIGEQLLAAKAKAAGDALTAHEAAANPHPVYLTAAEGNAAYDAAGAAAAAQAASQPVDADLTAVAALTTPAAKIDGALQRAGGTMTGPLGLMGYTVAALPAAGTAGRTAYVTDALAPTYLVAVVGGGAVVVPVFDNGAAWVAY